MSYTAAETGRVKSIKSKFENLNSLESLDISATVPHKYRKPSPSFLFKRSSTSIDLPVRRIAVTSNYKLKSPSQPPPPRPTSSIIDTKKLSPINDANKSQSIGYLRRHNNLDRTASADAFVVKKRNLAANDEDTLKPLKEIKENVEVRLTRHTNDPVKRSSIKRSPAFRVGDKSSCNNSNSVKHCNGTKDTVKNVVKSNRTTAATTTAATTTKPTTTVSSNGHVPVISTEFAEKFENLLKQCDIETRQQLDGEPGLTDTLKAVLRQPLPSGPPPKKPPRTFIDSPKQPTIQKSETPSSDDEKSSTKGNRNHVPAAPTNKMRQKIDLLENQLVLKANSKAKGTTTKNTTKHPFSSSLLNCIPCSSTSIYDTMIIGPNQFGKVITSKEPPSPEKSTTSKTNRPPTSNIIRSSNNEPIYMEPFAHLKQHNAKIGNGTTTPHKVCNSFGVVVTSPATSSHLSNEPKLLLSSSLSNTSFDGPESLGSSLTSCTSCTADDHSINDLHDIHYMVSFFFQLNFVDSTIKVTAVSNISL